MTWPEVIRGHWPRPRSWPHWNPHIPSVYTCSYVYEHQTDGTCTNRWFPVRRYANFAKHDLGKLALGQSSKVTGFQNFQCMCQIDKREGTERFVEIARYMWTIPEKPRGRGIHPTAARVRVECALVCYIDSPITMLIVQSTNAQRCNGSGPQKV